MNKEFHVAVTGSDLADGTKEHPFRTISKAAKVAETGDKVIVHEGEYREWVKPEHSGYSNINRITYEAVESEKVVIKGSERIQSWEPYEGTVWKVILPNTFFSDYNPYKEILSGDWFMYTPGIYRHPGEVYLNGVSF
jgi:alpha-N-arabinofuranosidase